MKEKLKERKGITLIALVVTIVVLLILAGVTIALVLGDNGIIKRAQEAKTATEVAQIKEIVQTDILEIQASNETASISRTELKTILDKYFTEVPEDYTLETEITSKAEYGSHKMKVSDIYKGTLKEKEITSQAISKAPETYYGKEVKEYELPNGTITDVNWKIFYADGSNIYLIADNCVERENLPNSTTAEGTPTDNKPSISNNYPRAAYFKDIVEDYSTGSARITDAKLQALNNDYFTKKYTSTYDNMKAVAYMMDTNAWNSKFKDVNNKAEYVIGGPTVELLFKSYNDKYKTAYESQAAGKNGYKIRKTSSDNWEINGYQMLSTSDSLYIDRRSVTHRHTGFQVHPITVEITEQCVYARENGRGASDS